VSQPGAPPAADESGARARVLRAWALYDVGNSAFATTVMAGFFPIFFKHFWSAGSSATESTLRLGIANSTASLLVALAAPLLGAVADLCGAQKRLLLWGAGLGVLSTAALPLTGRGDYVAAGVLYAAACVGFSLSIALYDSLIVAVARSDERERASALGYAWGYLGGGALFALNVAMTQRPAWFGLADEAQAVRASFVTVALWWAAFSLPIARHVPEPPGAGMSPREAVQKSVAQLVATTRKVLRMPSLRLFLLAYWLYIDGVDTIIRMAVDYGLSLGLPTSSLITALLIVQFVGFPATLVFGRIGARIGNKRGILLGLALYVLVTVLGHELESARDFYVLAVLIGLVQGGVQALSRALYSHLIPKGEAAELFGFYNMLGKTAAIIGPALMGVVAAVTGSTRTSILAVAVLLVAGALLLWRVPEPARQPVGAT
jgi:UMF1 family MFS transporter